MIDIVIPGRSAMYDRLIKPLATHIPKAYLREGKASGLADLVYYGNYGLTEAQDVPVVTLFTHREPADHEHPGMRRLHKAWDEAIENSDVCVAMSEAFLDYLPDDTEVIYPGLHSGTYTLTRLRVGVAGAEYDRNRYRKGYDLVQRLQAEHSQWCQVERTDGTLNLTQYAYWLRGLHAYLVPSRYEGGPMAPIEAMALGTPVVSARVGFMATVSQFAAHTEQFSVQLFDPGDYDQMVNILYGMFQERQQLATIFNVRRWVAIHQRIFEGLL